MIVYLVTNKINDKQYVGITNKTLEQRKENHMADVRNGRGYALHKAIRKYGEDVFTWQVIDTAEIVEELTEKEKHYIQQYNTYQKGYNLTLGGEGWYGREHSDESKARMREAKLGKSLKEETKAKMSELRTGEKHNRASITEETAKEIINMLLDTDMTMKDIANELGVSFNVVRNINNGATWKHLYDVAPKHQVDRNKNSLKGVS